MPVTKIITANQQKHGTAVVWVGDTGSSGTIHSQPYNTPSGDFLPPRSIAQLSGLYETRFDDALYYSTSGGAY